MYICVSQTLGMLRWWLQPGTDGSKEGFGFERISRGPFNRRRHDEISKTRFSTKREWQTRMSASSWTCFGGNNDLSRFRLRLIFSIKNCPQGSPAAVLSLRSKQPIRRLHFSHMTFFGSQSGGFFSVTWPPSVGKKCNESVFLGACYFLMFLPFRFFPFFCWKSPPRDITQNDGCKTGFLNQI